MNEQQAEELIRKYRDGKCSQEELALLYAWYNQRSKDIESDLPEPDYAYWQKRIATGLPQPDKRMRKAKVWSPIAAAAAIIAIVFSGVFYYNKQTGSVNLEDERARTIVPGKQGATLTLADGTNIRLADQRAGQLAQEAGVVIEKTAAGLLSYRIEAGSPASKQSNTLSTANGETYQVRLPDGSLVWLNAASSLTFEPDLLSNDERHVRLEGEGYFEIAKDKAHPFIVETKRQRIDVLGTHFNVSAYSDEAATKTTLLEGRIRLSRLTDEPDKRKDAVGRVLEQGDQCILTDQSLQMDKVDLQEAVAWKNGYFRFDNENIQSIMRKLSRWYDIEVHYEGPVSTEAFSGTASRSKSIDQVLNMLEYSKAVRFTVKGRRVTVTN